MKFLVFIFLITLALRAVTPYNKVIRQPKCLYLADVGPCDGKVKVYGYDYVTNRCVHFIYGGCGGNPNRFATKKECMDECHVEGEDTAEDEEHLLDDIYMKDEL